MHYYIDGYNLLFRTLRAGDDLRKQRQDLIVELETKSQFLELDVTIVFDSHYQPDEGARSRFKNLEVCYSGVGETADDFILQELKEKNSKEETVVTSDRQLAWRCRRRLAQTISVEEFMAWLDKRCKNKRRQIKLQTKLAKQVEIQPLKKSEKVQLLIEEQELQKKKLSEGSFDYYLETFQAHFELEMTQKPAVSTKTSSEQKVKKQKKKLPKETPKDTHESNMQHWLKAFERKTDNDDIIDF